ncbi:hypothetical protein LARI1_G003391 [Lachnellula arida]|uniref:Uncharacterized protein n=1 Tax=Lachnellula arida TaxID=1316785 RepID=A0A8T9BMJ8_9HELO|nr:hypothetical protein LARI1_G003391 [Lachnellula arida]
MAANGNTETAPEFLYHIKRTITDYHEDKSGATRTTDVLGTFTDLKAAKAAAYSALASEGYIKDDFELYEDNTRDPENWKHGDVLQTTINYNNDRIGGIQTTEVEGTYPSRAAAYAAAGSVLIDDDVTKSSFAEYDEKENFKGDWPYGDEAFVHAVKETGENFLVAVKAQPHSHQHHKCVHHGGGKLATLLGLDWIADAWKLKRREA